MTVNLPGRHRRALEHLCPTCRHGATRTVMHPAGVVVMCVYCRRLLQRPEPAPVRRLHAV